MAKKTYKENLKKKKKNQANKGMSICFFLKKSDFSERGTFTLRREKWEEGGLVESKVGWSREGGGCPCKGPVAGRRK